MTASTRLHMLQKRLPKILLAAFISVIPVLVTLMIIYVHLRTDLNTVVSRHYHIQNDAFFNWHQILTFKEVGFAGGYYTIQEMPAPISAIHFYAHGPAFPIFYGLLARIFGWNLLSPFWFNVVILSLVLFVAILTLNFDYKQMLLFALLLAGFWPICLYLPSNMQESIHHADGVGLAI